MAPSNSNTQETQTLQDPIIIHSSIEEVIAPTKIIKICWNTGEEKNCPSCYLNKGCKAKT